MTITDPTLDRYRRSLKRSRAFSDATYNGIPLRAQRQLVDRETESGAWITFSEAIVDWVDLAAEPVEGDALVFPSLAAPYDVTHYRPIGDGMLSSERVTLSLCQLYDYCRNGQGVEGQLDRGVHVRHQGRPLPQAAPRNKARLDAVLVGVPVHSGRLAPFGDSELPSVNVLPTGEVAPGAPSWRTAQRRSKAGNGHYLGIPLKRPVLEPAQ